MTEIICAMCGFRFDPATHLSCTACPLHSGCQLACCPNCGYDDVDPNQSVLARFVGRLFRKSSLEKPGMQRINVLHTEKSDSTLPDLSPPTGRRLTELPPGSHARMLAFTPEFPGDRKAQLQAYGMIPGHDIWIRQHKPVTVIQVEHTELAFEANLADAIFVEEL